MKKLYIMMKDSLENFLAWLGLSTKDLGMVFLGNFIMAFSLVNIHIPSQVSEGGVIGLSIIANKVFGIPPASVSFVLDMALYVLGFLILKNGFLRRAIFSTIIYSLLYGLLYELGPVLPSLAEADLIAAILGGVGIGLGCGMVVTRGSVAGGDDCFALIVSKKTGLSLGKAYFIGDALILFLAYLTYMPLSNVFFSLISTFISSYIVGQFEIHLPEPKILPLGQETYKEA